MKKRLLSKIRASYFFNFFAVVILFVSLGLNSLYEQTQLDIIDLKHRANIEYVKSLSANLSNDIVHILKKDFLQVLREDSIARAYIESDLKLFVTTKYKYIYLISKSDTSHFVYLADAGVRKNMKKMINDVFEPRERKYYESAYSSKEPIYFPNLDDKELWATYLSPIIVEGKVEAIIVIKFSILEQKNMYDVLEKLHKIFMWIILFFILLFLFLLFFSYLDSKREEQKKMAFKELKKKSHEILELNMGLEKRIAAEVHKNRIKDAHLVHQARLAQMGEMISMIAHQWRQPLASISAQSAHLQLKAKLGGIDNETLETSSQNISRQSQYLSDTIDDFRDFFSPDKEKTITSYNEIVKSVQNIIDSSLVDKNIKIMTELGCNASFESYPNELKQVILNLIKNAQDALVEHKPQDAFINIKTYTNDSGEYVLEVSDNAGGIAPNIIEKIFDPYFSTKTKKDGTGLGLYMSKMIVEEHCHGILDVINTNEGALFSIRLRESA